MLMPYGYSYRRLGLVDYTTAYQRQKETVEAVIAGAPGRLIFVNIRQS